MNRYELHIGEQRITGTLGELKIIAQKQDKYYEIHQILFSSMGNIKINSRLKMKIKDFENIFDMFARGRTKSFIKEKYHMGDDTLNRILDQQSNKTKTIYT